MDILILPNLPLLSVGRPHPFLVELYGHRQQRLSEIFHRVYGPGFYLFKLEKTAHSPHYEYHKFDPEDPASHRRSIYRFIVRSQPDPFMTTFNCAD